MKQFMSPEDFNSRMCDIANDYAQARQEMCAEDFQEWEEWLDERYGEEPDTSGPVHSDKDAICCYCGSDKEPNVQYEDGGNPVHTGVYYSCECRSIVNDSLECIRTLDDDDDLPF